MLAPGREMRCWPDQTVCRRMGKPVETVFGSRTMSGGKLPRQEDGVSINTQASRILGNDGQAGDLHIQTLIKSDLKMPFAISHKKKQPTAQHIMYISVALLFTIPIVCDKETCASLFVSWLQLIYQAAWTLVLALETFCAAGRQAGKETSNKWKRKGRMRNRSRSKTKKK
jgi:hypothetical protein